jgi:hypothetical protein
MPTNPYYAPSYSSSPFELARISNPPLSTLDVKSMTDQQYAASTQRSILDVVNSLGNIVLGGIAISRIPSQNIGVTSTTMSGRATGTTIVPPNAVGSPSSKLMPILLIGLVIVGVVLLAKRM